MSSSVGLNCDSIRLAVAVRTVAFKQADLHRGPAELQVVLLSIEGSMMRSSRFFACPGFEAETIASSSITVCACVRCKPGMLEIPNDQTANGRKRKRNRQTREMLYPEERALAA